MKVTFVIVGTLIEFSMIAESYDSYTTLTKMTYKGNEYDVKLYSQNEYEMLFHLYLIPNDNDDKLKQLVKELEQLEDELPNGIQYELMPDTGIYNFNFKYMKGGIDYSNPIANMVKPPTKEENIQILKHELKVAIRNEDYELCAKLRDKINEL